jgi:acyl-CoA thioester hydrolase
MPDRPMLIEKEIRINAYDIDVMGIVSNIVYIRWFEDLRLVFLDQYYPYTEMMQSQISPILLKTEVEYKASLTMFDKPVGRCWLVEMGKSKWEMAFEISAGPKIYCTGKQTGCFYHLGRRKPIRVPENLLQQYNREIGQ